MGPPRNLRFPFHPPKTGPERGVLVGSGRPINPIRHGSSRARAAVLQFMNLLWAPPRIPRGVPAIDLSLRLPGFTNGPDLLEQRNARSWWGLRSRTREIRCVRRRAKINPRRGEMFVQLFFSREIGVISWIFIMQYKYVYLFLFTRPHL